MHVSVQHISSNSQSLNCIGNGAARGGGPSTSIHVPDSLPQACPEALHTIVDSFKLTINRIHPIYAGLEGATGWGRQDSLPPQGSSWAREITNDFRRDLPFTEAASFFMNSCTAHRCGKGERVYIPGITGGKRHGRGSEGCPCRLGTGGTSMDTGKAGV